jgi:sulfoxide reductase heme-binding subunit YedZ
MIRLGRAWKTLHRLVYLAALLAALHYGWAAKGDFFSLRGDVWKPLVYSAVVILLLLLRLPVVRKWVINTRERGFARN